MASVSLHFDVVIVGGANTDFWIRGKALPKPGSTVEGEAFQEAPGGKGANQAVAAARLGAEVAFIGRIGADERGQTILAALRDERVDVCEVTVDAVTATGVALVMIAADGQKQIMTAPGANHRLTPEDIGRAGRYLANATVVLLQLELPPAVVETAARLARAAGARVVLDPAPARELPESLLRDVHIIRPNAGEAEALTGVKVKNARTAEQAASHLSLRGAGAAVVSAPGGNWVASTEGELWLPHHEVNVVDSTGAGDAFAAALAVRTARGDDLMTAARFANAAAAMKTTQRGAQAGLPSIEEVERLLSPSSTGHRAD